MNVLVPLTELITYILFSILIGHVALQFVSPEKKPSIYISRRFLLSCVLGIILFTFGPLLQVVAYFGGSVGVAQTLFSVLFTFEIGKAWIAIVWCSILLWLAIYLESSKYIQAVLLFLMVLSIGYASHVASLSFWTGFTSHTVHFLAVTLWAGILIQVSWFSKDSTNWDRFLRWFTPFAVSCMIVILISGVIVMLFVIDFKDYVNAWVLPYGQMLLFKHISIIPLLVFAFINGILVRRMRKTPTFDPRLWVKAESICLVIIFFFTGVLGTLSPPHDIDQTVKSEGAVNWVTNLLGSSIKIPVNLEIIGSSQGIVSFIFGVLFLIMIVLSFYKKKTPVLAVFLVISFIISTYLGLMTSVALE
ncbi:copper resistance D family protein (plasmid) [Priestia megaterium]|uniref:copper resistance D family protein n=1 Tax=Priestia TaxID=2800373 RepID=UPI00196B8AF9|nr:CopD family protein [Priestia sp. JV24]MCW1048937.1 CopD family protein [Priestia sp. JV24]QSF42188.1 CopD family protein [Priestia megaterium]